VTTAAGDDALPAAGPHRRVARVAMAGTTGPYRHENGVALIELRLGRIEQLFESLDPAPFREKDLDPAAEEYIVEAAHDLGPRTPARLIIHLAGSCSLGASQVEEAVRAYFGYRVRAEEHRLRALLRTGLLSLAIGGGFLMLCIGLRRIVVATWTSAAAEIVAEGLLISGWVAMWRPIQIFLYDWWPIRRSARLYARLAAIPVECRGPVADLRPAQQG